MVSWRGCASTYFYPYLSSLRTFEEKKSKNITTTQKLFNKTPPSLPAYLTWRCCTIATPTIFSDGAYYRSKSYFTGQQTTNFYSKYTKIFWATCRIPKKLEIHLKINLFLKFSCFHSFSWVLREAELEAFAMPDLWALLHKGITTAKQGYTKN